MKPWIAVTGVLPDGRVSKFWDYAAETDAQTHIARTGGFVSPNPGGGPRDWKVVSGALLLDPVVDLPQPPLRDLAKEIDALQARIETLERARPLSGFDEIPHIATNTSL